MKNLFNFYLEDDVKVEAMAKLDRLCGDTEKGKLAAFLRVVLDIFVATSDDAVNKELIDAIAAEYILSTSGNKRSKL